MSKKVYLFDGTSLAYRAFYAIQGLSTSKGLPTNAVFGFIRMFLKLYKDFNKPEYVAVAFDVGKKTFRNEISKDYKANRKPTPDSFKIQLPYIKKFLKCLGIPVIEKEGYEADDVLGTLSKKLSQEGYEVVIVTPDKDMRQLINNKVSVVAISNRTGKKEVYDLSTFKEKYGIEPDKLPDVFGLSGDSIDNIPGVPGIGEKTALKLIQQFGSLENLYENLKELTPKRKKLLEEYREQAFLSKKLAVIDTNVPIDVKLEDLKVKKPDAECLKKLFKELEMKSVVEEIKKLFPEIEFENEESAKKFEKITKEKLLESLSANDLFSMPDVALIHESPLTVAVKDGYAEVEPHELEKFTALSRKVFTFDFKSFLHKTGFESLKDKVVDLSVAYYLLNPLLKSYSAKTLIEMHTGAVGIKELAPYAPHVLEFGRKVISDLKRQNLYSLYEKIEHPLIYVLYRMEKVGVPFNREYLERFGRELDEKCKGIEKEIHSIAGEEFNINSTKQLARVLFEKLKLKPLKKTKTGYSTDVETLTALALEGHKIAKLLLEYRKLSKLNSTFVRGILKHVDESGRVHTTFIQTGTATGRLSSAEPNLQNLPVSDEISKKIRYAVEAPEGKTLVWADYSQIELRILAHLSGDETLINAYKKGKDIHSETAYHLFGRVDDRLRRIAKTVNFGIIYGMSPHGLAERLGIPVEEAAKYIDTYFKKFPKVKEYIDSTVEEAYKKGYVKTLFGRKRPLPELKSPNKNIRNFGERAAVNATVQGTAADIMKMAMVELFKPLEEFDAFMILQVHDEIVVEAPQGAENEVKEKIKDAMESVVTLSVPLLVEVESGRHWN